jgi:hypothetical protein
MPGCVELTKEMLSSPFELSISDNDLTFSEAREIADRKAFEINPDAMLLAWFDRKSGTFSPRVECCSDKKPGWLVYAESRGGEIVIDINDEEYVFVYLG